jgi:hypothetical protein
VLADRLFIFIVVIVVETVDGPGRCEGNGDAE